MYERFTDRARKVMQLSCQQAQRLDHDQIQTEDILLALIREGRGIAAQVLQNLNIALNKLRQEVEKIVQPGPQFTPGKLPLARNTKRAIEYAMEEAINFGHDYVGTEHLLLGMIREKEGVAGQILREQGRTLDAVRTEVLRVLEQSKPPENPD